MRSPELILTAVLFLSSFACDNEPGKGKAQAAVASAVEPATVAAAAPAVGTVTYAFSNQGSKLEFTGAKVTAKHEGAFNAFRGTIQVVDGKAEASTVTAEIDTASLAVEPAKLAGHLKSADFFDVAKFPKAKFTSTAIKPGGANGATHTVTGNLELHGVTKSVSFPATLKVAGDAADADAEFAINRKDFAIVYTGMPDDLIKDDILIKLRLRAKKT